MTREELRNELYKETGEWFGDDELDMYMGYNINDDVCSNNLIIDSINLKIDKMNLLFQSDEDEPLLGDNLIEGVNDLFSMVLNKAKTRLENSTDRYEVKQQVDEIAYFAKIFICKCFLYVILKNGKNKGYIWRSL